jgi:hypothetical protein
MEMKRARWNIFMLLAMAISGSSVCFAQVVSSDVVFNRLSGYNSPPLAAM